MAFQSPRAQDHTETIETLQEFYSRILEYYDELFPVKEDITNLMLRLQKELAEKSVIQPSPPCRYLGIGCATGTLENRLVAHRFDITGIDKNSDMIASAKRRMKPGFSSIRFFEMTTLDMRRFLKAGSFNIITSLENLVPYLADPVLVRKFFHDCRELLSNSGILVVQTLNYDAIDTNRHADLPDRSSIRVILERNYDPASDGQVSLSAVLELGTGRTVTLQKGTLLLPLKAAEIEERAKEAGFTAAERFGGFNGEAWSAESPTSVFIFR